MRRKGKPPASKKRKQRNSASHKHFKEMEKKRKRHWGMRAQRDYYERAVINFEDNNEYQE